MTNVQLYLAIGVPMLFNAVLVGILIAYVNSKFEGINEKFAGVNRRFDDMRDLLARGTSSGRHLEERR
jgi:hypothetical protein